MKTEQERLRRTIRAAIDDLTDSVTDLTTAVDVFGTRLCEAVEVLAGIRQPPPGAPLPWPHDDDENAQ